MALSAASPGLALEAKTPNITAGPPAGAEPRVQTFVQDDTLFIGYTGEVVPGMAKFIASEFLKYRGITHRVVLILDSGGGQVGDGKKVIEVLCAIRQTHQLETAVLQGATCASMCVPIYLQGTERHGAASSLWLFHDAIKASGEDGAQTVADEDETLRLFRRYFVEAGVRVGWINHVLRKIAHGCNFWQTGRDLVAATAGVITGELGDVTERPELEPTAAPKQKTQQPPQPSAARPGMPWSRWPGHGALKLARHAYSHLRATMARLSVSRLCLCQPRSDPRSKRGIFMVR